MPATPHPLGETPFPRADVRWIEPIVFEPVSPSTRRADAPARRTDVRWVEFDPDEAAIRDREAQLWFVSRVSPRASRREPEIVELEPELVEPTFVDFPGADEHPDRGREQNHIAIDPRDEYPPGYHDAALSNMPEDGDTGHAGATNAEHEAEAAAVYIPEEDGSLDLFAPPAERSIAPIKRRLGLARLRGFAGSHRQSLSRVTILAGALALLVALSYYGGEHLAGLAGAMTPPQSSVEDTAAAVAAPSRNHSRLGPAPAPAPVDEDAARAASFIERAKAGDMVAQYNVAVLYASGKGLTQDFTSAAAWFGKAADAGSASAQFNLGVMYQRGLGVRRDPAAAFLWYRRAADRHYAPAEYNLAVAYAAGQGTPADPVAAARWYHQAAVQGVVPAMFNFAILYEKGEGVERSLVDAYAWYRAGAQRGDADAEKRAGELLALFDAGRKRTAQSLTEKIAATIEESTPEMTPLPTAAENDSPPPVANSSH